MDASQAYKILHDTKEGHAMTLTGHILLRFSFGLLVKAVNVFSNVSLHRTFLFTGTIASAAKI